MNVKLDRIETEAVLATKHWQVGRDLSQAPLYSENKSRSLFLGSGKDISEDI